MRRSSACRVPGVIDADGGIEKGAQNLPGNWESSKFNLPAALVEAIPEIGGHDTTVLMHNDGVAQGLSEVPFMQEFKRWGVLTIGTGLGNARFTNRKTKDKDKAEGEGREGKRKSITPALHPARLSPHLTRCYAVASLF